MYLDACIVAKLLLAEPDSLRCAEVVEGSTLVSSELVYGEITSLLLRKQRAGEIGPALGASAWTEFERLLAEECLWLAPLTRRVVRDVRTVMLAVHPRISLRTLDAIHLATYLSVVTGPFFTRDARLRQAAELLDIPVVADWA
ncbi:MAG TPA: type II toxin-antitoxin system VapC family toxin [Opitutaceae bacterium]|jgi:predicted nucleic acid-binding protein|nr:type II toxin-antitoxin system VapC family toxin [Opitutaceae bacterium]